MTLHRLLYQSEVAFTGSEAETRDQVRLIAESSAAKNSSAGLSGALLHSQGRFIQALEGSLDALEDTFERICCDLRHRNVTLLEFTPAEERLFGDWAMAEVTADASIGGLVGHFGADRNRSDVSSTQATIQLLRALLVAPARTEAGQKGRSAPSAVPRILVVDDVMDNRSILHRRLSRRGMSVTEADCGEAAIPLLETERFDVVLLDVMMPGMSGLDVLSWIRDRHSPMDLPVIMVTGKSFSSDVATALRMGADDYLTKPINFAAAMASIETQLSKRSVSWAAR